MEFPRRRNLLFHSIDNTGSQYYVSSKQMNWLAEHAKKCNFTFDDGYEAIYDFLRSAGHDICKRVFIFLVALKTGEINDWDSASELAGKPLLNWEQIRELQKSGVRFGSHSLTHTDLRKISNRELEKELKESKRIIEAELNETVEGFAYPFGLWDQRVLDAVKKAGYKWAVTTSDSILEGLGNPFRQRRINISGNDPRWLVWAKVNGLYDLKALWEFPKLVFEKMQFFVKR